MIKIEAQYPSYDVIGLGGKPDQAATLFRRILREALHLIGDTDLSKKDLEINPLENLVAATQQLLGDCVITVTKKPTTWTDIVTSGDRHPLFEGWTDYPAKQKIWPHETNTRFLWHHQSGLICATKAPIYPKTWVALHETQIKAFLWAKGNLPVQ